MAGKLGPTVTLTFAGDATSLDKTVSKVGSSTEHLATSVGKSTKEIGEAGEGMKTKLTEAADGTESKMIGLHDVVDGLSGTMQGFKDGSITEVSQGLADMAGGIAAFVIPALGSLGSIFGKAAGAVKAFSITLLTSPITYIILGIVALIAIIVLLVKHWDTVKHVVSEVTHGIVSAWNSVWHFLSGIFGRIGRAARGIFTGIGAGLGAALNGVISLLNNAIDGINFLIRGFNSIPFVPDIPQIPHIPHFHTGGVVPGVAGSEMLAVLQAGERVIPATGPTDRSAVGVRVLPGADQAVANLIMHLVRSGKLQLVTA